MVPSPLITTALSPQVAAVGTASFPPPLALFASGGERRRSFGSNSASAMAAARSRSASVSTAVPNSDEHTSVFTPDPVTSVIGFNAPVQPPTESLQPSSIGTSSLASSIGQGTWSPQKSPAFSPAVGSFSPAFSPAPFTLTSASDTLGTSALSLLHPSAEPVPVVASETLFSQARRDLPG